MNYLWQIPLYLLTAFLLHHGGVSIIIWSYGKEDLISLESCLSVTNRNQREHNYRWEKKARYPKDLTKIQEKSNHLVVIGITVVAWLRIDQEFDLPRWLNFSRSITKRSKEKTRLMHVVMLMSTPCFIGGKIYTPNVRFRILYSV